MAIEETLAKLGIEIAFDSSGLKEGITKVNNNHLSFWLFKIANKIALIALNDPFSNPSNASVTSP